MAFKIGFADRTVVGYDMFDTRFRCWVTCKVDTDHRALHLLHMGPASAP